MTRLWLPSSALLLVGASALSSCAEADSRVRISAAASLQKAFTQYGRAFDNGHVDYSFAGSDELAAQIEQGALPDLFASANLTLPERLYAKGVVEKPVEFAANRLVLAVPRDSRIASLAQIERPGVSLAVGTPTVPVGGYTATALSRLPLSEREQITANVRDRESDVTGIVGKLTEGAAQAGFVYATDVSATGGALRAIQLPASLQPRVGYAIAVVRGSPHQEQARAFIQGLLHGAGGADLRADGFMTPAEG